MSFTHADTVIAQATSAVTSQSVTLPLAVNAGDLLVGIFGAPDSVPTITDNVNGAWNVVGTKQSVTLAWSVVPTDAAAGALIVTNSGSGSGTRFSVVDKFRPSGTVKFLDGQSHVFSSGTITSGDCGTLSGNDGDTLTYGGGATAGASITFTAGVTGTGSGGTGSQSLTIGNQVGNSSGSGFSQYLLNSSPGTNTPTFTCTSLNTTTSPLGCWAAAFTTLQPRTVIQARTLGYVKGATGGTNQQHLVYATGSGRWWFFTWGTTLDSGTATGGDKTQLIDTNKTWTASQYLADNCFIISGPGAGQAFEIGPNTSTVLQVYDNASASPPQPGLPVACGAGSVYAIVDTRRVRAYVSSGSDLTTATWSEASGSPSEILPNSSGIDMSGGANDGGHFGEFLADGRLLAVGYQNISGTDLVNMIVNENLHWTSYSQRARLGVGTADAISWDLIGAGSTWNTSFSSHNEGLPTFPRPHAMAASTTGRWHVIRGQDGGFTSGMLANNSQVDDGSQNFAINFATPATDVDRDLGTSNPWQAALVPLASGFMLLVNTLGQAISGGSVHYTNLRYQESTSESTWSTTAATGTNIPNLSSSSNRPNDWGITARTTSDIHLVRRDQPTVLEHIRYSGHGGSWGSVTTIPATGLYSHLGNSGVALVSDGTSVWCFVIDTDTNNSIRYNIWNNGSWNSSWYTINNIGSNPKNYIYATMGSGQIGVTWSEGADPGPYSVKVIGLSTTTPTNGSQNELSFAYSSN